MMKKEQIVCIVLLVVLVFSVAGIAHTYKLPVVVDTDTALDDLRAITMLLNSDGVDIRLIVTSDGSSSPRGGYENVSRLLTYFHQNDTRVAAGRTLSKPSPEWRSISENIEWPSLTSGSHNNRKTASAAVEIVRTLEKQSGKVVYLCLGPMTNISDAIRLNPGIKDKISSVVFFGAASGSDNDSWNYRRDAQSADFLFSSGLRIVCFTIPKGKLIPLDKTLLSRIKKINTKASRIFVAMHRSAAVRRRIEDRHMKIWDEMIAIYLNKPSIFKFAPQAGKRSVMILSDVKYEKIPEIYLKSLGNPADFHLGARKAVIFKKFPVSQSLFREDVGRYVREIIDKHGYEEWKACLLTNEFHRHLGIYSIIGAKMGIRAREILNAPFDELQLISYAGRKPTISCMNDGLQVSTGASLGRGTIVIADTASRPAAIFIYEDKKLTLKIKKEVTGRIKKDIKMLSEKFGFVSPEYYENLRILSVRYWLELNRNEIFIESIE